MQTIGISVHSGTRPAERPIYCPMCHRVITVSRPVHIKTRDQQVEAVFHCPNPDCDSLFIAYYTFKREKPGDIAMIERLEPTRALVGGFHSSIARISPTFISVYKEAIEAKARGLLQIAGP